MAGNADDGDRIPAPDRRDHRFERFEAERCVLHVDQEHVEAAAGDKLGDRR